MNSPRITYERNIPKGLLAGFIATMVLSVLMLMKTMMGLIPQLDVIAMLSGMLGSGPAIGWLAGAVNEHSMQPAERVSPPPALHTPYIMIIIRSR